MSTDKQKQSIAVSDFDSVHQASIWLRLGAEEAKGRLTVALRTAILIANELTLDRNQLLDGIYFLTLGPRGIAHILGLPNDSPLPIVVNCEPLSPTKRLYFGRSVPIQHGASTVPSEYIHIDYQLQQILKSTFTSSAKVALFGSEGEKSWMYKNENRDDNKDKKENKAWYRGCGLTPFHNLTDIQIFQYLKNARAEWINAMANGQVKVDRWGRATEQSEPNIHKALNSIRSQLSEQGIVPTDLGEFLLSQRETRRTKIVDAIDIQVAEGSISATEAYLGLEMWSRAYYQAIAEQSRMSFLTFFTEDQDDDLARRFGLVLDPRSKWQRVADRVWQSSMQTIRVEGQIFNHMTTATPAQYANLYASTRKTAQKLTSTGDIKYMFDLALASSEIIREPQSYSQIRKTTIIRTLSLSLMALIISASGLWVDLGDMSSTWQIFWVLFAALLGMFAGIPWDDIYALSQLRSSKMAATLTLSDTNSESSLGVH